MDVRFLFVVGYLLLMVGVSLYLKRKMVKSSDDFAVAGRRLPMIVLVGTLLATWCGGGGISGSAGLVYKNGPLFGILLFAGAPIGMIVLYFISGAVRKSTTYTIPELFELRYGAAARNLAAICIILAYIGTTASQFKAAGNIFMITSGIDFIASTVICVVFMALLALIGGMVSVAYTDALSAFMMVFGFLFGILYLSGDFGGFGGVLAQVPAEKNSIFGTMNIAQVLGYVLPTLFLVLGDQNMIQRFSSAKDSRTARKSNVGLVIAEVVVCALIIGLVTCAIPLYPTNDSADTILFQLAAQKLPTVLGGIVMAACMSFVITTGDSYLLSTASNLTYDVWVRLIKKDADDKQKLNMLRISIVLVAFLAFVLGFYFPDILSVQMYAYTMYGATITPALICALFYKKATKAGGLAGIITGAVTTIIWDVVLRSPGGVQSAIISVPLAFIAIFLVSAMTQNGAKIPLEEVYKRSEESEK
nr:sodium:solute symporter family protein [uncultured Enterocloster sp.]